MLSIIVQILVSGIANGAIYGLTAIEYTLIWNSCGLLNFAHTKTIMFGAYVFSGTALVMLANAYLPALVMAVLFMGVFGALIASVIFIPLRNFTRMIAIMATVMLGTMLNEAVPMLWGVAPMSAKGFLSGVVRFGGAVVSKANIYIIFISIIVMISLKVFMSKTKPGRAMVCVSQDKNAAALMGVNVRVSMTFSVALSFMICGLLGCLCAPLFTVQQTMTDMVGLKGFAAGVIGGFGNISGAIIGGFILGLLENIACMIVPSIYKDVVAFTLLIIFLLVLPGGISSLKKKD